MNTLIYKTKIPKLSVLAFYSARRMGACEVYMLHSHMVSEDQLTHLAVINHQVSIQHCTDLCRNAWIRFFRVLFSERPEVFTYQFVFEVYRMLGGSITNVEAQMVRLQKQLALSGDVESNPGPQYPVKAPRKMVEAGMDLPVVLPKDKIVSAHARWYIGASERIYKKELHFVMKKLMLCGDVESNPGPPVISKLAVICYNCYRIAEECREEGLVLPFTLECLSTVLEVIKGLFTAVLPSAQIFGLSGMSHSVTELASTITETVTDTKADVAGIKESILEFLKSAPEMISQILDKQCGVLPVSIRTVLIVAISLIGLYVFTRAIKYSQVLIYQILDAASIILSIPLQMVEQFKLWVTLDTPCAQLGEDASSFVTNWIPTIVPLFFSIMGAGVLKTIPSQRMTPDVWMQRVANLPRTCKAMGEIYSFCKKWVDAGLEWVEEAYFGTTYFKSEDTYGDIKKWMDEVTYASQHLKEVCSTSAGTEKASTLWIRGTQLLRNYQQLLPRELVDALKRMLVLAAKVGDQARQCYARGGGVRMVPLLMWLTGESQIGKSSLTYYLIADVLSCFGLEDQVKDHVYARNVAQEYWDGYNGQFAVVYDDFGQMRDTIQNPNLEPLEIIRGVGSFDWQMHMADLTQKANTFFSSKFILCSSNDREMQINSLTYPDAVWNRFQHCYDVRIKPEYQQRLMVEGAEVVTLNKALAAERAPIVNGRKQPINLDVYEFYPFDARNRTAYINSAPISYHEMSERVCASMRERIERGTSIYSGLDDYARSHKLGTTHLYRQAMAQMDTFEDSVPCVKARKVGELRTWLKEHLVKTDGSMWFENIVALNELEYAMRGEPHEYVEDYDPEFFSTRWSEIYKQMEDDTMWARAQRQLDMLREAMSPIFDWVTSSLEKFRVTVIDPAWKMIRELVSAAMEKPVWFYGGVFALSGLIAWFAQSKRSYGDCESHNPTTQPKHLAAKAFARKGKYQRKSESHNPTTQPKHLAAKQFSKTSKFVHHKAEGVEHATHVEEQNVHPESEMAADQQQLDVINQVFRQQYLVSCSKKGKRSGSLGTLTFLKGSIGMMPYHFYKWMEVLKPDCVYLTNAYIEKTMTWDEFDADVCLPVKEADGTQDDVCFVNLFAKMPPGKDITHHFATLHDLGFVNGRFDGALSGLRRFGDDPSLMVMTGKVVAKDALQYRLAGPVVGGEVYGPDSIMNIRNIYEYQMPTQPGYCGMLLTITSTSIQRKILGMHVAGQAGGTNWGIALCAETILEAISSFPVSAQLNQTFNKKAYTQKMIPGAFLPVASIDDGPYELAKSTIERSVLYGKLGPVLTKPAYLRPFTIDGVTKDPMTIGVQKAGANLPTMDTDILHQCAMDVFNRLSEGLEDPLRVISVEEACRGVPGDDLRNPISSATSTGYGWDRHGMKGKSYYLGMNGFDPEAPGFPELEKACHDLVEKMKRGEDVDTLALDCLKDERRPIGKVNAGKTRVFTVLPMDLNVVFRQYFMDALVHTRRNRIKNGICVGLNVWGDEWEQFYKHLTSVGSDHCGDGDFANLDGTLSDKILWEICWIMNQLYDDEHSEVRKMLWQRLVYCTRHYRGTVYQCTHSLPSGIFGTSDFGSMYLLIAFRYIWMTTAPPEFRTLKQFNENVRLGTYGDDNIWSVTPPVATFWSNQWLEAGYASIGMTYTDAAKTGVMVPYKSIYECQFLKRFFKWSDILQRHTCPAEIEGRLESLNWTRKNNMVDSTAITRDVIQDVLREVAAHGDKKEFDRVVDKITKACAKSGLDGVVIESFLHYHYPPNSAFHKIFRDFDL